MKADMGLDQERHDSELLAGLRAGKQDAFAELVRLHSGPLLAMLHRLVGQEQDAQDALQEAFLSAFRGLAQFDGHSSVKTWLHRIAINAGLMKLRSRRGKTEEPIDPLLPHYLPDGHRRSPGPAWQALSAEVLEAAETRELVHQSINRLPESYRVVLVLRDIEGLDTSSVAQHLGLEEGTVKTRLHRARQALRTLLSPYFEEGTQ